MSGISTIVPQTGSILAQTSGSPTTSRADTGQSLPTNNSQVSTNIAKGGSAAAVVSLSSDAKRASSSGTERSVDESFEKTDIRGRKKQGPGGGGSGASPDSNISLSVSA